jgi:hypothetical protein
MEDDYGHDRVPVHGTANLDRSLRRRAGMAGKSGRVGGGKEGFGKDESRLPANSSFRSARSAYAFVERMTKRGIDRRE